MKLNWVVNLALVLAVTYPISLVVEHHRDTISDFVLVLVCVTIPVLMLISFLKKTTKKKHLDFLILNTVLFGVTFLNRLINQPRAFVTILAGITLLVLLIALLVVAAKELVG